MDDDPLSRFRRREDAPPQVEKPIAPDTSRVYQAFEAQDKVLRLDILRTSGESHCPAYAHLLDIVYGSRFYSSISLVFTTLIVNVNGKSLKPVVTALKLQKAAAITEFDAELFDWPADGEPMIERIDITGPQLKAAAMRE